MTETSFRSARPEDRAQITAVAQRYAHNAREGVDIVDMMPLFTSDAVAVLPNGTRVPIANLGDVLRGEEAKYIRHHLTTVDITFEGDDTARVECQFFAITNEASPDHWGCWRDRFVRTGDAWLIAERAIVVDGGDPGGWFLRMYGQG